jgi:hypothetical protein
MMVVVSAEGRLAGPDQRGIRKAVMIQRFSPFLSQLLPGGTVSLLSALRRKRDHLRLTPP